VKIAVSASDKGLESSVDPRFGRCPYFIIVETEGNEIKSEEAIENTSTQAMRGAGIAAAQLVANKGVKAVISGNIGPNAFNVLSQTGIRIFTCPFGITVREAVKRYLKGELKETAATVDPGFGFGRGRGGGRGAGGGRGRGMRSGGGMGIGDIGSGGGAGRGIGR